MDLNIINTDLYLYVFLLLGLSILIGEAMVRIHQISFVGQVLIGIILGPSLLNIIGVSATPYLLVISNISVFFLMFLTGIELDPIKLYKSGKEAVVIALTSFSIPMVFGFLFAYFVHMSLITSLFIGMAIAITALPVVAVILTEMDLLNKKIGYVIMTASVFGDVIAMFVFSLITVLYTDGTVTVYAVTVSVLKMSLFISAIISLYLILTYFKILSTTISRFLKFLKLREINFALMLTVSLVISLFAMYMGLAFITGTFFSGLLINKESTGESAYNDVKHVLSPVTYGFFAPLFFAITGIELVAQKILSYYIFFILLLVVAVLSKIFAGVAGGTILKKKVEESFFIGAIMNSRGMVDLVIISIGYGMGIIDSTIFSLLVAVVVITTIISPTLAYSVRKRVKPTSYELIVSPPEQQVIEIDRDEIDL